MEQSVIGSKARQAAFWRAVGGHELWRSSLFLVLDLPVGVIFGTTMLALVITGLSLVVTFLLAIPVFWLTIYLSRVFASIERSRIAALLGHHIEAPARPSSAGGSAGGWLQQLRADVTNRATWKEFGYHCAMVPVSAITYTLLMVAWVVPILLMSAPLLTVMLPDRYAELWVWRIHAGRDAFVVAIAGVILAVLATRMVVALAKSRVHMARVLLGTDDTAALQARVEALQTSRSALVDAVDAERKRIERDLHDGAQQRLVAVAMDLGMVKNKLDASTGVPPEVRELIDSAHIEAKRAISELRDVARGVHPAILEDRGLGPALSSLAARCPVPVRIDVQVDRRPNQAVEAVAYYVVAESLTNIAKHASASKVIITVKQLGNRIGVEVTDDGRGGATIGETGGLGGGLAGLRDRVASVDGRLTVMSPIGGPTTILAELPCG